ncbi:hypothetical protein Vadar_032226 [Vaccinium darrowii]|uniref:Uncharacterized protein n=1 Tax=Vaccinium darrowii TaxID=229202 RepID=A0ACB7Z902_9ERIC|nr:hypothetical protein Vadar_032226 [Vaccinium darrowii]
MKIKVKESTIVKPAKETPKHILKSSNLDLLVPSFHAPTIYFYKPNGSKKFFDTHLLKEALSNCLVVFYPVAGRLRRRVDDGSKGGGFDVDCNGKGALFVEAEAEGVIDDFGDFAPCLEIKQLIPTVDCSDESFSFPLLLLQNGNVNGCLTSSSSGSRYMSRDDGMLLSLDAKRVLTMEYLPGININRTQALDQLSVDRERASLNCVCGGPRRLID